MLETRTPCEIQIDHRKQIRALLSVKALATRFFFLSLFNCSIVIPMLVGLVLAETGP